MIRFHLKGWLSFEQKMPEGAMNPMILLFIQNYKDDTSSMHNFSDKKEFRLG